MTQPSPPALLDSTSRRLLALTARAQRDGRLPSLVAGIVRGERLVWSAGRGAVDEGRHTDVQYRIGSITKTVTAVAVMRLRDEGRLALDDPLDRHVPGTPFGERTIGQLLAHDAGLRAESPGEWWERVPGRPWPAFAGDLTRDAEVRFPPGRRFHYSNLGFGALGEVVARLRGRSWEEVVRDEVLLPLGMTRTTPRPTDPAAAGTAVHPWADLTLPEPEHDAAAMAPAGQLWATLTDLGRFASFLMTGGDVLSEATVEEMREPAAVDGSATGWSAYGLGLQLWRPDGRILVGHSGSMPGFIAMLVIDVAEETAALNLMNGTTGPTTPLAQDLLTVVREAEPHVVEAWSPLTDASPEALALTGEWYWGVTAYGLRLERGGELALLPLLGGGRASRFMMRDDGTWLGLVGYHAGETLAPVRDAGGAVVALDVSGFIFTRTPYDATAPVPGGVDPAGWR